MKLSSLRDFERAGWQWREAGRFLQARLTLSDRVPEEAFLRLPPDWAFFWKSKEASAWFAAWGLAEEISFDELMAADIDPQLTICGGFPFAAARQSHSEWAEFTHAHWFVPKFLWRQSEDAAVLEITCPLARAQNDDSWKARWIAEAWHFYQALHASPSPGARPAYTQLVSHPQPERWHTIMSQAHERMRNGAFDKVVLSRRVCLEFSEKLQTADLLRQLLTLQEESFIFACQSPEGRCFMGRSPERLLAWQGRRFQLDAIAGTRRRSLSASGDQAYSDDMQQSPKEQNEHQLVRQAITDLLQAEGVTFVPVEEQAIIRLQHVQHMRTRFEGEMPPGRRPAELLPLLHPTPAVGGYPRRPALDFMLETEGYDRGWFAGGIGVFQGDHGDVAIGIRSALVADRKLWIYAGAGIVPGSDADAEWLEIEAKMQNFLGFFKAEDASK
ncbi:isochorismate synthase [Oligoflexus tunisiensis]|uniref:isochorismate synthase n=1 Tax=Oligoflexus tunisiensis TaxID=708132 RepID=UPI00114CA128|nr:isochorismate synthase [Oligoflexus tunisiensis]